MSSFAAPVVRVRAIEPIPGADAIELAVVGDYRSVVRKGQFVPGDRAIYLPEGAVLPDTVIEDLGLAGKLRERRRRWSDAEKLRIVAEAEAPDACFSHVARRNEIDRGLLWTRRTQITLLESGGR